MATRAICSVEGCDKPHLARGFCNDHYRRFRRHGDPEGGGTAQGALRRWIDEVALHYTGDDCLIWPFGRDKDGYAQGRHPGLRTGRAYRAVCELAHGAPPTSGHEAAHSCGRGHEGCVAPAHLSWKTHAENEADKKAHGTLIVGSDHANSRLTEDDVREVRRLFGTMTHEAIAERFGVARATISLISSGATWAWLT
jgi:hypothetical protein